ncbi:hypothetical protein BGX33_011152, partial [Mortierella sp. NVP41]
ALTGVSHAVKSRLSKEREKMRCELDDQMEELEAKLDRIKSGQALTKDPTAEALLTWDIICADIGSTPEANTIWDDMGADDWGSEYGSDYENVFPETDYEEYETYDTTIGESSKRLFYSSEEEEYERAKKRKPL